MSHEATVTAVRALLRAASQPVSLPSTGLNTLGLVIVPANYLTWLESTLTGEERDPSPFVSIEPGVKSGTPTLNGTRLPVESVAEMVWDGFTLDAIQRDGWREVRLSDALVCCWYMGLHGGRRWRQRWEAWAKQVHPVLWNHSEADYTAVPWPPTAKGES